MEPPKTRLSVSFSGPDHDSRFSGEYTQHGMKNNRLTYKRDSDQSPYETFLMFKKDSNTYPFDNNFDRSCGDVHAPRWAFNQPNAMSAIITPDLAININSAVDKESAKFYYSSMFSL